MAQEEIKPIELSDEEIDKLEPVILSKQDNIDVDEDEATSEEEKK